MIDTDSIIGKFFIDNFSFLKYIHPNIITICGFCVNFILNKYLLKNNLNLNFIILLNIRMLIDILDGCVARKYNKTSKIGNILDTLSDNHILLCIIYFLNNKIFKFNNGAFLLGALIVNIYLKSFENHDIGHKYFILNNSQIITNLIFILFKLFSPNL